MNDTHNEITGNMDLGCDYVQCSTKTQTEGLTTDTLARLMDAAEPLTTAFRMGNEEAKRMLPAVCWAARFDDHRRHSKSARASGLFAQDIDHIGDARDYYEAHFRGRERELGIVLAHITPSGDGLRIVAVRPEGLTVAECQQRLSNLTGTKYDPVCRDLGRMFYLTGAKDVVFSNLAAVGSAARAEETTARCIAQHETHETPTAVGGEQKAESGEQKAESGAAGAEETTARCIAQHETPTAAGDEQRMAAVVSHLLESWGIGGVVLEGARNVTLYKLARLMRYLTDFNAARLCAVLPRWGLSEEEAMRVCESACNSARGTEMPSELTRAMRAADELRNATDEALAAADSNPIPERLPQVLDDIARLYPTHSRNALIASLPALGALLSPLRCRYFDGEEQSPVFMAIVIGPQASGKSFARSLSRLIACPMADADAVARRTENDYREALRRCKNTTKQPDDPKAVIRLLPATVSNAMLLKRADRAQGRTLYTFAEEIDTVMRGNRAGAWSEKSDIFRQAFDAAEWGQDYMSEASYSATVRLRYNLLYLGTPMAVRRFFRNVEDGTMTRFAFTQMPDSRGQMLQWDAMPDAELPQRVENRVRQLFERAESCTEPLWVDIPRSMRALWEWQTGLIEAFEQSPDNQAIEVLRRRAGVMGFRAAMVAWALEGEQETDAVVDFARWVAQEVFQQQMALFAQPLNEVEEKNQLELATNARNMRIDSSALLLNRLQDTFTRADLVAIRRMQGRSTEVSYILTRWTRNGLVTRLDNGSYQKVKGEKVNSEE